jgi:hypothetical protein
MDFLCSFIFIRMKLTKILKELLSEGKDKYEVKNVYLNGRRIDGVTIASSEAQALSNVIIQNLKGSESIGLKILDAKRIKGYAIKKLPNQPTQEPKKHWTDID